MDGLRELGVEVWFSLGDRDLAIGLERARRLADGQTLTQAHAAVVSALEVGARVLPMSDRPVRTRVLAAGTWWGLQERLFHGAFHAYLAQSVFGDRKVRVRRGWTRGWRRCSRRPWWTPVSCVWVSPTRSGASGS